LREYLLMAQDHAFIERYRRQGDVWILTEAEGLDASMLQESIGYAKCTTRFR
jgi:hypothetical protein